MQPKRASLRAVSEGSGTAPTPDTPPGERPAPGVVSMAEASPVDAHFTSMRPPSGPFWITVLLGIVATLVFIWSAAALFVFGVGVAIAFFLVPVVNWLERRGLARWISAILAVVTTLIVSVLLVGAIALIIVQQGLDFVATLPELLAELDDWYASLDLPDWLRAGIDSILLSVEDNLAALDQGIIVAGIIGGFANLIGGLFAWLLLPFFLFYLLKDQPKMAANFYDRVPAPWIQTAWGPVCPWSGQ